MPSLIYPKQELWKPEPFWQRWRNAAGERIRLDSGARMNDTECCCGGRVCDFCSDLLPEEASVTFTGFNGRRANANTTFVLTTTFGTCGWNQSYAVGNACGGLLQMDITATFSTNGGNTEINVTTNFGGFVTPETDNFRLVLGTDPATCQGTHDVTFLSRGYVPKDCGGSTVTQTVTCSLTA